MDEEEIDVNNISASTIVDESATIHERRSSFLGSKLSPIAARHNQQQQQTTSNQFRHKKSLSFDGRIDNNERQGNVVGKSSSVHDFRKDQPKRYSMPIIGASFEDQLAASPPKKLVVPAKKAAYERGKKQQRGWNPYLEVYVKRVAQRAGGFKWMHSKAATYYTKCYNWIGIICIIASSLSAALNIPYITTCENDLIAMKWVGVGLGFVISVVLTFQQFKSFGGRSEQHVGSEASFDGLHAQIKFQLLKNSKDRQDANDYVEWISKELSDLKAASPMIPEWIWREYRLLIHGNNVADPDGIDEIMIKTDSPPVVRRPNAKKKQKSDPTPLVTSHDSDYEIAPDVDIVVDTDDDNSGGPPPRAGFLTYKEEKKWTPIEHIVSNTKPIVKTLTREDIEMDRWNERE